MNPPGPPPPPKKKKKSAPPPGKKQKESDQNPEIQNEIDPIVEDISNLGGGWTVNTLTFTTFIKCHSLNIFQKSSQNVKNFLKYGAIKLIYVYITPYIGQKQSLRPSKSEFMAQTCAIYF